MNEHSKSGAQSAASKGDLKILHLYPRDMNIYGDNGNVQVLQKRIGWHGYTPIVIDYNPGDVLPELSDIDIVIGGGGQDSGQNIIQDDLSGIGEKLKFASEDGTPMLMVCGMYQLFGKKFVTNAGDTIPGINIFDIETTGGSERLVGNIVVNSDTFGTIVGYENHSGQTKLGKTATPLGSVILGAGNNSTDGHEGTINNNTIGTYLHGPILPKNPVIADFLISTAAKRRFGHFEENTIDDSIAMAAKKVAKSRPR